MTPMTNRTLEETGTMKKMKEDEEERITGKDEVMGMKTKNKRGGGESITGMSKIATRRTGTKVTGTQRTGTRSWTNRMWEDERAAFSFNMVSWLLLMGGGGDRRAARRGTSERDQCLITADKPHRLISV
ncbi:hypothetical protein niasHS_001429 [Heterodera schachtii]|uniref:Uncharacterized protein n=1 Tax=Heterodera schachtii TaxID=97005 RepID=A0ABD2KDZ1_HETSC